MNISRRCYSNQNEAILACESYLHQQKQYNTSREILSSEVKIIDRFLARRLELFEFYSEIYDNLEPNQWKRVISVVLYTAAFWNPEAAERTRGARNKLIDLNEQIEKHARILGELLQARYELSERYGLDAYEKYHIADLIDDASQNNGHYWCCLQEPLQRLSGQYDLKYWPSISSVVVSIANDAASSEVAAIDSVTHANISSPRSSLTDYFKAYFKAIDEERVGNSQFIPSNYELSDESLASVANCALDLSDDKAKDGQYIKRLRQRIREQRDSAV